MARKVLCVEDRVPVLRIITSILEEDGYQVIPAISGRQALELFAASAVDGVLLKSQLPDLQSMTVRRQMKRMNSNVPVWLFRGIGEKTRMLLRFLATYLDRRGLGRTHLDLPDY